MWPDDGQLMSDKCSESQTADNTGSPKFCFDCKPGSVLEKKMVDSAYSYCPYCGAKLRESA